MKEKLFNYIESIRKDIIEMADYIFDNPELGLKEYKSAKVITDHLRKNGFIVEMPISNIETAFKATYKSGKGGISIGLLCEYDALEGLGHACAHHMQAPSIIATALALKEILKDRDFNIVVYGTPAEETLGCKIQMAKDGCFRDIDFAFMMHGAPDTCVDVKSLAMSNFDISFHGTTAHAALAPEKGRSSLDCAILFFNGVEFLREHVREDTRMHYTITEVGGPANIVPKLSKVKISLRSYSRDYLNTVIERIKNVAKGASLMTETNVDILETKSLDSKIPVYSLNDVVMENAKLVNAPNITPPREKTGSTDFGNVMYLVPGTCIRIAFVEKGTSSHSDIYVEKGKSKEAHDAIIYAAKILASSSYDIISSKELSDKIKKEFSNNKNKN